MPASMERLEGLLREMRSTPASPETIRGLKDHTAVLEAELAELQAASRPIRRLRGYQEQLRILRARIVRHRNYIAELEAESEVAV